METALGILIAPQSRQLNWSKRYKGPQAKEVNASYMECLKAYKIGKWKSISGRLMELDQKINELLFVKQYGKLECAISRQLKEVSQ